VTRRTRIILVADGLTGRRLLRLGGRRYAVLLGPPLRLTKADGTAYRVTADGRCTCPAWRYASGRPCKHVVALRSVGLLACPRGDAWED
jgi:hypothetical protein